MNSGSPPKRSNLIAASLALILVSVGVVVSLRYCKRWSGGISMRSRRSSIHPSSKEWPSEKEAFAHPDLFVFYGSSELVKEMPNNATQFFQDYPTGFRMFPVGKPGTTSLAVLQKIAAMGEGVKGRKLAYSISPGWFFTETFDPKYYEGNFSALQASELVFASPLSRELKRDVARRMLDYPKTMEGQWTLRFALERLANDGGLDRAMYAAVWPLGRLQTAIGRAQDHLEAALHIVEEDESLNASPHRGRRILNWSDLLKRTAQVASAPAIQAKRNEAAKVKQRKLSRDKVMVQTIAKAKEWTDLELLMRTLDELGAKPLLLSMPVEDIRLEAYGASAPTREAFVQRLDTMAERFDFPLMDFREHEKDPAFLVDFLDHLSAKGWLYYNKALDDFFHGRISSL